MRYSRSSVCVPAAPVAEPARAPRPTALRIDVFSTTVANVRFSWPAVVHAACAIDREGRDEHLAKWRRALLRGECLLEERPQGQRHTGNRHRLTHARHSLRSTGVRNTGVRRAVIRNQSPDPDSRGMLQLFRRIAHVPTVVPVALRVVCPDAGGLCRRCDGGLSGPRLLGGTAAECHAPRGVGHAVARGRGQGDWPSRSRASRPTARSCPGSSPSARPASPPSRSGRPPTAFLAALTEPQRTQHDVPGGRPRVAQVDEPALLRPPGRQLRGDDARPSARPRSACCAPR